MTLDDTKFILNFNLCCDSYVTSRYDTLMTDVKYVHMHLMHLKLQKKNYALFEKTKGGKFISIDE
jgi:hypothetical protein